MFSPNPQPLVQWMVVGGLMRVGDETDLDDDDDGWRKHGMRRSSGKIAKIPHRISFVTFQLFAITLAIPPTQPSMLIRVVDI